MSSADRRAAAKVARGSDFYTDADEECLWCGKAEYAAEGVKPTSIISCECCCNAYIHLGCLARSSRLTTNPPDLDLSLPLVALLLLRPCLRTSLQCCVASVAVAAASCCPRARARSCCESRHSLLTAAACRRRTHRLLRRGRRVSPQKMSSDSSSGAVRRVAKT